MILRIKAPYHVGLRVLAALGLLASSLAAAIFTPAAPALATDNCSNEQTIFVWDGNTSTSYGTIGHIYIRPRNMDSNCSGFRAWSMVNIFSVDGTQQAETGYRQYDASTFDGVTCYQFSLVPLNESCHLWNSSFTLDANTWYAFKVAHYPLNTNQFVSWVKGLCTGCADWQMTNSSNMPFDHGNSNGETGRYGHTSGMLDHHSNLMRKDSNDNWHDWGSQTCSPYGTTSDCTIDGDPNWKFYYNTTSKISNTEYEVCQVGGSCPWQ